MPSGKVNQREWCLVSRHRSISYILTAYSTSCQYPIHFKQTSDLFHRKYLIHFKEISDVFHENVWFI